MLLFIDDERNPEYLVDMKHWLDYSDLVDCVIARTSEQAINFLKENGIPPVISFDHDLGGEDTAMKVVHFIVDQVLDGSLTFPENFLFMVHSSNPVGSKNIQGLMNDIINHCS